MARIPESEIEQLKLQVSLVRLAEAAGIALKPHGKDLVGRCPFHDDKTPSLVISPKANLWHCLGACQAGGSVVDWVMRFENVSFRRAVDLLRQQIGAAPVLDVPAVRDAAEAPAEESDAAALAGVIDYYHAALQQSAEAQAYLARRGLDHPDVVAQFRLGYANRTLGYRLGSVRSQAGAARKAQLIRLGLFRESGHEHFNGSLVVPVIAPDGEVVEVYGRKIGERLRQGTPLHLYLPGPHRGVFNEAGLVGCEEVILCEALLDALTFWCAGYRNVTASYGIEGFTDAHVEAFARHGIRRVLIAYDADAAGDSAADKLATRLMAEGFECYRCRFPKGSDANQYALDVKPASKALGLVIRQAEWLGNGAAPQRAPVAVTPVAPAPIPSLVAAVDVTETAATPADIEPPAVAETLSAPLPEPPAYRVPPSAEPLPVDVDDKELRVTLGDRVYTVRGIDKNLSYEQLKVWLKVARGEHFHIDTVELYTARQRAAWCKAASVELGLSEDVARSDLGALLRAVETRQDALLRARLSPIEAASAPALSAAEREAALALLRDPALIERIVADVEAAGVVGEASNALVAYLACVSRKLDKPLAILIQSTSAAGKSTLMDAILALMPESERVHYSAMTGQSLFYLGEQAMKHKILAIAEEEGVRQAAYALKVLQSQGVLTIASTGKDPTTGDLQTKTYTVEGPVMLFLTTTATVVDEELQNRGLVLTIDESREQTAAILSAQRASRTLAGLQTRRRAAAVLATHRAAQTLIEPLAVVNPFAEQLGFATDRVRLRRDQQKYLTLIEAITLLQQHQRPVRTAQIDGAPVAYVEVTAADIALANRLAHEVLGRSLDELPPHTRRLLGAVQRLVGERATAQGIAAAQVRFTRRELRLQAGLSDTQLRVHLDRLVALEYVLAHAGRNGQRFVYELAFDGEVDSARPQAMGLIEVGAPAVTTSKLAGENADLAGRSRPACGALAGSLRGDAMAANASVGAQIPALAALGAAIAPPAPPPEPRRNGASYRSARG
jgi:DNA primase catalytic core